MLSKPFTWIWRGRSTWGGDTHQLPVGVGVAVDGVGLVVLEGHEILSKFFQHNEYSFQIVALCLALELQNFGVALLLAVEG